MYHLLNINIGCLSVVYHTCLSIQMITCSTPTMNPSWICIRVVISRKTLKKWQMTENKFNKWWLMREGPPALSVGVEFLFYLTICYLAPFLIHSQYSIPSETRYGRVVHQRSTNTEAILDYIIKHIRCKMSDMVLFGYTLCVL